MQELLYMYYDAWEIIGNKLKGFLKATQLQKQMYKIIYKFYLLCNMDAF